jgi:hypothetical protein
MDVDVQSFPTSVETLELIWRERYVHYIVIFTE